MKKYSLIVFILSMALMLNINACKNKTTQSKSNYSNSSETYVLDWQEVAKMEEAGKGKTIIDKTDEILQRALEEKNAVQIFKALAYRSKYIDRIEEDAQLKILAAFEKETQEALEPLKSLLHSATAELYYQYYNQNRWRYNQRSEVIDFEEEEVQYWSLYKIQNHIANHYRKSLQHTALLQNTPLESFKEILIPLDSNSFVLRPTLYDLLADRALSYFKINEGRIAPFDKKIKKNEKLFLPTSDFIKVEFEKDVTSNTYNIIEIYKELAIFHSKEKGLESVLIEREMERLKYAHSISSLKNKDELYLKTLKDFEKDFSDKYQTEIWFAQAEFYYNMGTKSLQDQNELSKNALEKTMELCAKIEQVADEKSIMKAGLLRKQVLQKSLAVELPKVTLPQQDFAIKLKYKNFDQLYFRLYRVPILYNSSKLYNFYTEKQLEELSKLKVYRQWKADLPLENKFQILETEVQIDGIEPGSYLLLAAEDSTFNLAASVYAFSDFQSSNLAYFLREDKGKLEIYARDRTAGKALSNIKVQLLKTTYNRQKAQYFWENLEKYTTDSKGYLSIQNAKDNYFSFYLADGKDTLIETNNHYLSKYPTAPNERLNTYLYTDRAIYRPGQTVHFKGIVIKTKGSEKTLQKNYTQTIQLYNTNGESVQSIELKTNEYGSYYGSFILPKGDLKGEYRIQDRHGNKYFSVEDYKRPTFELVFDTTKGNMQLNQTVTVSGKVERFAGGNMGKTNLQYHIVRRSYFPFQYWYLPINPIQQVEEVANGELVSEEDGSFSIEFFAEASEQLEGNIKSIENFEITIEATAANGEVQGGSKTISIGAQPFYISTNIAQAISHKDLEDVVVYAKNSEQKEVMQDLNFKLWKLEGNSENIADYKKGSAVKSMEIKANQKINLEMDLNPSAYLIEIEGKTKNGELVKYDQRFLLYDENSKMLPAYSKLWVQTLSEQAEVGESFTFLVGSSWEKLQLFYEIEQGGQIIHSEWLQLNQEQKKISLDIPEKYRGGFTLHFNAIQQNEYLSKTQNVPVTFSNKKLKLSLRTYRNLLEPGNKEKWELRVSGNKGEKVNAEVLLGMYSQDLDALRPHNWDLSLYQQSLGRLSWRTQAFGNKNATVRGQTNWSGQYSSSIAYPTLNWYGFYMGGGMYYRGGRAAPLPMQMMSARSVDTQMQVEKEMVLDAVENTQEKAVTKMDKTVAVRKDFRETVFFYPTQYNAKDGVLSFEFTMPDALTKWKLMALAHTQSLEVGKLEHSIQTQKRLMLFPNLPRFLREGDTFEFSSMLENNSDALQEGVVKVQFFNALNNQPIDLLVKDVQDKEFKLSDFKSQSFSWNVQIPEGLSLLQYRIVATSQNFSDGQEGLIPVLAKKQLITESLPLPIRSNTEKEFVFSNLLNMKAENIQPTSFTVELTANPVWYAVQALPYLNQPNTQNPEQVFHALFANSIAQKIIQEQKRIQEVFETWKALDSDGLLSKLEQNEDLKEILIQETPWLKQAKSESDQKQRIALLFEVNQMQSSLSEMSEHLLDMQLPDGGWPWFKSMRSNTYITSLIVEGFGLMHQMGISIKNSRKIDAAVQEGVYYLDEEVLKKYHDFINRYHGKKPGLSANEIRYLYIRSMNQNIAIRDSSAYQYYLNLAKKEWAAQDMLSKALLSTTLYRINEKDSLANLILMSLKEHAIEDEEMGMYWKENTGGQYWYNAKIETQAMLINAFDEVLKDKESVEEMKIWLLKQKQTQAWEGSRATALAVYSLLMHGEDLLSEDGQLTLRAGDKILTTEQEGEGSAYVKKQWTGTAVQANMGKIRLKNEGKSIAWGAAYIQYYQDFDQLEQKGESGLKVDKSLFKVLHTDKGRQLSPINKSGLQVGDRVLIRLKIAVDRTMEFVHLKDQPAVAFEPIATLSSYRAQDGLYYYQTISDASTSFFFENLPRGNYVFEYEMRVTQTGDFGIGSAVIQSHYAPEFKAYSKSQRVKVGK